ncbi:MAG: S8 family serine peptidase, partial [Paracoccaceae bacterium]
MQRVLLSVAALALLSGCGGEEAVSPLSYLSQFLAPGPKDPSILAVGAALPGNIVTLTNNLLNTGPYQNTRTSGWTVALETGTLTGLNSDPLRSSGAAFAHAAGFTGKGQVIAVSDESYISGYQEFAGTAVTVVNNWIGARASDTHGTVVSSVAVGESGDFIGVAPDAALLFGTYQNDQSLTALGNAAIAANAVAWNNSWGYPGLFLNERDFNTAFAGNDGAAYYNVLSNYAAQGVVVFALANDERLRNSQLMEGLPFIRPSLEAGWIAAANGVPSFSGSTVTGVQMVSSDCYEAARWCLIADGTWQVPDYSLRLDPASADTKATGTSFAAPQIAGALAVLAEAFPTLSPHDLRVRLLASAEDGFFQPDGTVELATGYHKGYSVIYGHGFLDIEAALQPIGPTAMALADGSSINLSTPVLAPGLAMGDAVERGLSGTDVAVQDALAASFAMPANALVGGASPTPHAAALMAAAAQPLAATPQPLATPFAAYRGQTLRMAAPDGDMQASVLLPQRGESTVGLMLSQQVLDGPTRLDLGLTVTRDGGGTLALGGVGGDAAVAASVSLGMVQDIGDAGFLALAAEVGLADLGSGGSVARAGMAQFNRLGIEAGRTDVLRPGDRISIGLGMPLAITRGAAEV